MSLSLCIYLGTQLFNFKNLNLGFVKPASMNAGGCPQTPSNVVCGRSRMPATLPKTADCFWGTAQLGRPPPPQVSNSRGSRQLASLRSKGPPARGTTCGGVEGGRRTSRPAGRTRPTGTECCDPARTPAAPGPWQGGPQKKLKKKVCCLSTFDENATAEVAEKNGCRRKKTGRRPGTTATSRFRAPSAVHQKCQKMHCQLFLNFLLVFF